jgi:hypothetical protein
VDYPVGYYPTQIVEGDFNGDGMPDLAVTTQCGDIACSNSVPMGSVDILLANGDGTFQPKVSFNAGYCPTAVAAGDLNEDGYQDLVVTNGQTIIPAIPALVVYSTVSVLLGNGDGTFRARTEYPAGTDPIAVTLGDFNSDGIMDLAVTVAVDHAVSILLGKGDGTFQTTARYGSGASPYVYGTPASPLAAVAADFNGDGKPDLAVTNRSDGTVSVLLANGDGTFQARVDYLLNADCAAMAVGDLDGDGNRDLVVVDQYDGTVSVLLGKGDGTFRPKVDYALGLAQYNQPGSIVVADFNKDGKQDLAVTNSGGNIVSVLLGNGNGTFQPQVGYATGDSPSLVAAADFNRDGKQDLVVTDQYHGTVSVLLGNGDGTFRQEIDSAAEVDSPWFTVADFNGDGRPDLAVLDGVLLGNGDGTFQPKLSVATGLNPIGLVVADFNRDGKQDLAVIDQSNGTVNVLLGNGDGTFQAGVEVGKEGPVWISVGDFNGDGNPDLMLADMNGNVSGLAGNGDGTFLLATNYLTGHYPNPVLVADLNNDGAPDLASLNRCVWYFCTQGSVSVLLNTRGTWLTLQSSPNPSWLGNAVTLTVTVAGSVHHVPMPTGNITFLDGTTVLGSSALNGEGVAALTISTLAPGPHDITVVYGGDTSYSGRSSRIVNQVVNAPGMALGIPAGGSNSATVPAGETASYTLSIGGAHISGTASFTCTGAPLGATCVVPASVNFDANTASTFNVTVTTTSRDATAGRMTLSFLPWTLLPAIFAVVVLPRVSDRRQITLRALRVRPLRIPLLLMLLLLSSCGGGNQNQNTNPNGTPAGTYALTITAHSRSVSESTTLTLTVR